MPAWTPADLATRPIVEVYPASATVSGAVVTGVPNSGASGGSFVAGNGTVAKGAQIGGRDTLAFSNASLKLLSKSRAAGPVTAVAVAALEDAHGGLFGWRWDAGTGMVWYARDGGFPYFFAGQPFNSGNGASVKANSLVDGAAHIQAVRVAGDASGYWRVDGTNVGTPEGSRVPAALTSETLWLGEGGPTYSGEFLSGRLAYFALFGALATAELEKLEGWAAWTHGLQGLLPSGHPYKTAAPVTGAAARTFVLGAVPLSQKYVGASRAARYLGKSAEWASD